MRQLLFWLSQPQNSSLVLLIVTCASVMLTAIYVVLTHGMAKAVARQTRAMLQPVLTLDMQFDDPNSLIPSSISPSGGFKIKNVGGQPVVLLDVKLECIHDARVVKVNEHELLEDYVLSPPGEIDMGFDFKNVLDQNWMSQGAYSMRLLVVASDLSRQYVSEYEVLPVLGLKYCRLGMPSRVKVKLAKRWLRSRSYPITRLFNRKASIEH